MNQTADLQRHQKQPIQTMTVNMPKTKSALYQQGSKRNLIKKTTINVQNDLLNNKLHSTMVSPKGIKSMIGELKPRKENTFTQSLDIASIRQKINRDIRSRQHDRNHLNADDRSSPRIGTLSGTSDLDDEFNKFKMQTQPRRKLNKLEVIPSINVEVLDGCRFEDDSDDDSDSKKCIQNQSTDMKLGNNVSQKQTLSPKPSKSPQLNNGKMLRTRTMAKATMNGILS